MLINVFQEISFKDFIKLDSYKKLPLNEQKAYYDQYISDLAIARQNWIQYQNKGINSSPSPSPSIPACSAGMDVVFVIDYTLSMGSEINDIKNEVENIVDTIITESNGDYRLGLTLFDEYEGGGTATYASELPYTSLPASQKIITPTTSIPGTFPTESVFQVLTTMEVMSTANESSFKAQLADLNGAMSLGRGAGAVTTGEPGDISLLEVIDNNFAGTFRSNVAKLIILITDDEPGGYDGQDGNPDIVTRLESLRDTCISEEIQLLVLSQIAILPNTSYRIISDNANGSYDNSLSSSTVITAIENICVENA